MPKHRKHQKLKPVKDQVQRVAPKSKAIVREAVVPWKDCFDGAVKFCLLFIVGFVIFAGLGVLVLSVVTREWSSDYVEVLSVEQLGDKTLLTFDNSVRYTPRALLDSSEVEEIEAGDWVVVWMLKKGFGNEKVMTVEEL